MSQSNQYTQNYSAHPMSHSGGNSTIPATASFKSLTGHPTMALTGFGAILGGVGALARDIRRVKAGEMTKGEASRDVLMEAAGTGVAAGVGGSVAHAVSKPGILSLAVMIAAGVGAKYVWDGLTLPNEAEAETVKEKPKAKK